MLRFERGAVAPAPAAAPPASVDFFGAARAGAGETSAEGRTTKRARGGDGRKTIAVATRRFGLLRIDHLIGDRGFARSARLLFLGSC